MCAIMSEEKKGELDRVTIKHDVLRKYFPKSYTPKQMEDTIIKLLEQWQRKREKSMERWGGRINVYRKRNERCFEMAV